MENQTNCKKVVFTDRLNNPNDPVSNDNKNESSGAVDIMLEWNI